jgi:hypothetical protein
VDTQGHTVEYYTKARGWVNQNITLPSDQVLSWRFACLDNNSNVAAPPAFTVRFVFDAAAPFS